MLRMMTLLSMVFCLVLSGCGPKYPETFPVEGTVTLDDAAVEGAAVVFEPGAGKRATGTTDASGRFVLSTFREGDGALPGAHRVTVVKTTAEPEGETVEFVVPREYGRPDTSGLTCDVVEEMEPVLLRLTSDGKEKAEAEPEAEPPSAEPVDP